MENSNISAIKLNKKFEGALKEIIDHFLEFLKNINPHIKEAQ